MWTLKYDINELPQNRLTDIKNISVVAKGEVGWKREELGVWD